VVVVTGANTGIGKAAALALARHGAHVVLVCRNEERGREALAEVRAAAASAAGLAGAGSGAAGADLVAIDLASLAAVRAGAAEILARHARIDALVNNAGIVSMQRQVSADGYELTFAVNQLAPFLLTELLLPRLTASAPACIVNVASEAHRRCQMRWDDVLLERSYSAVFAYAQSKLANILFTRELARRIAGSGVTANAVHPGVVATDLVRRAPLPVRWGFRFFGLSVEKGAEGPVRLAEDTSGVSGRYFKRTREATPTAAARDDAAAARLWALCEQLTGATR
jgi:NAD(P)-dependent dehydrogenase (short-subunit alcohol dehydrogenase family)